MGYNNLHYRSPQRVTDQQVGVESILHIHHMSN